MKVLVEYTQAGLYKDQTWGAPIKRKKGQLQAVEPAFAATLIKTQKACLRTDIDGEIIISHGSHH
ncbi:MULTISPECIES: hypothetical protein [Vibrio]|uniref:C factor cell-cell signaling protein n=1 Tax=Vibrio algicola TaxID=2662262 RepID=A0A5Q0TKI3_9VIBR|nr:MULTISPECIES: hypothetical protein [Vibrio]MBD1577609.1 hypothetical protein [Vibrio sp. S11_S32]